MGDGATFGAMAGAGDGVPLRSGDGRGVPVVGLMGGVTLAATVGNGADIADVAGDADVGAAGESGWLSQPSSPSTATVRTNSNTRRNEFIRV